MNAEIVHVACVDCGVTYGSMRSVFCCGACGSDQIEVTNDGRRLGLVMTNHEALFHSAMMHVSALLHLLRREGYDPSIPAISAALEFVAESRA